MSLDKSGRFVRVDKSYDNAEFMHSPAARPIRMLCELIEPGRRFKDKGVRNTIVFFGASRIQPAEEAARRLAGAKAEKRRGKRVPEDLKRRIAAAERDVAMSHYYEEAAELAERLARWSASIPSVRDRFAICSGGGPGIMEAANRGAQRAGVPSVGLNISLPMEQYPNQFQDPELAFEFHYFFIRKFWFVYLAKAVCIFPGGWGTFDEMFELLTLKQTRKIQKPLTTVVYGSEYWNEVIDFQALIRRGTIAADDLKLFKFCDDVDTAFTYIRDEVTRHYL
jgi:uncharacterized protein (TIGR00730 family)